ncbi:MAG: hypothetical protein AABY91_09245 [Gemmatimonadota bacterium]
MAKPFRIERALDPATRAELASWFARPSRDVVAAQQAEAVPLDPFEAQLHAEAVEQRPRVAARARALEPGMFALRERPQRSARNLSGSARAVLRMRARPLRMYSVGTGEP